MLRHKDNTILSEINVFFTTNEKAMHTIFKIIGSLAFSGNSFLGRDAGNNIYRDRDKLALLLLFPFFGIRDAYHYGKSVHPVEIVKTINLFILLVKKIR